MQKKIIALAVAGLVSGGAFAQSSVTVSGIMDMGYQYSWGAYKDDAGNKAKSMSEIKSGWDGSRIGFHGVEDLGNGLKVGFDAVAGFNIDTGNSYGGALYSEGSSLFVENAKWGVIRAGYFSSFIDSDVSALDVSGRHSYLGADQLIYTGKLANHVNWISPSWSGFKLAVGFSSNANSNNNDVVPSYNYNVDSAGNDLTTVSSNVNVRAYEIGATYNNGPLGLGASYIGYKPQNNNRLSSLDAGDSYEWQAGAKYDFKVAAVSLYYAATHRDENAAWGPGFGGVNAPATATGVEKSGAWALGLAVPITAVDNITFSYADRKVEFYGDNADDDKTRGFGFFYTHNLSKRTALYAFGGTFTGDSKYQINNATSGLADGYDKAFNVGIHHTF